MPFKKDFERAADTLCKFLGFVNSGTKEGERILSIENSGNEILDMFDKYSGIDAIQITKDSQIRTMACRVQWTDRPWNTFTIRYKRSSGARTEFEKRMDAIDNDKLYPQLTMQAYFSNNDDKLLSLAIVETRNLYKSIVCDGQINTSVARKKTAFEDGNVFLVVPWDKLSKISIYDHRSGWNWQAGTESYEMV